MLPGRLHSQQSEGNAEVPSAHFGTNAALSALQGAIDAFNSTLQIFPQAQVPGLDGVKQAGIACVCFGAAWTPPLTPANQQLQVQEQQHLPNVCMHCSGQV